VTLLTEKAKQKQKNPRKTTLTKITLFLLTQATKQQSFFLPFLPSTRRIGLGFIRIIWFLMVFGKTTSAKTQEQVDAGR